jgi:3-dehydrosphinganine reductase
MHFRGKVALITGGSSGIGLATARLLAEAGAHTWLLARREDVLRDAQADVESCQISSGQYCRTLYADVRQVEEVNRAIAEVVELSGVPDLVVNSAGVVQPGYFQDLDLEDFHWMMDVNYYGSVCVTKAVLPGMLSRGSGHIVLISSLAGLIGFIGYTGYSGSKFAIRGFSDALRAEMKPMGINVSIVFPPDTDTPQLAYDNQHKPPEVKATGANPEAMQPEEVARALLKGVARKQYFIIPGMEGKILYWLSSLLGTKMYFVVDLIVAQARRKLQKQKEQLSS